MTPHVKDLKAAARQKSAVALVLDRARIDLVKVYDWGTFAMEDEDVHLIHEVITHLKRVQDHFADNHPSLHLIVYKIDDETGTLHLHPLKDHMESRLRGLPLFLDISEYTTASVIIRAYAGNLDDIKKAGLEYLKMRGVNVAGVVVTRAVSI